MIFLILLVIGVIALVQFIPKRGEEREVVEDIVTRPPCASCDTPKKGCVSGMCSKKFGCG